MLLPKLIASLAQSLAAFDHSGMQTMTSRHGYYFNAGKAIPFLKMESRLQVRAAG
jgi:hypothetical protein